MSVKRGSTKSKPIAKLVTEEKGPCAFCQRDVDDELIYGKLYAIGSIKCHYFCVLLSCCLVQKGRDQDGLFGFLYADILAEVHRSKKHKCSYCGKEGATLGCAVSQCRKQFHLPCGREKNAVSLFFGSYKSFCQNHTPKQKIAENVMAKVKVRLQAQRKKMRMVKDGLAVEGNQSESIEPESVCVICYEPVQGHPTIQTFWPPCCARDAWFHRTCLQRMALSAGMHYLKCPLCNDKEHFYEAVVSQGYYVPDRDAAWELEQNAFADIYERHLHCDMEVCLCPMGRAHDSETGMWDIKLCLLCGSSGAHAHCLCVVGFSRLLCVLCRAANTDVENLADTIQAVMATEQKQRESASRAERRPIMPSRMSLRRTKQRMADSGAGSSGSQDSGTNSRALATVSSREELNLKPPKRSDKTHSKVTHTVLKDIKNKLTSPNKALEQLYEKMTAFEVDRSLLEEVTERFKRPRPLSVKRKILDNLLDNIFNNLSKDKRKSKEPVKEWHSPKKCPDITSDGGELNTYVVSKEELRSPYKSPEYTPIKIELKSPKTSPKKKETRNKEDNNDMAENNEVKIERNISDDESSRSTFQLPPEFIADNSNDSLPIFETPKLITVDIEKDSSLEISENDEEVNVNVVKMEETSPRNEFIKNLDIKTPTKSEKCAFKFSPLEKEILEKDDIGFDLESFKKEVAMDLKCENSRRTIDFAMEESTGRKRSIADTEHIPKKKKKTDKVKIKKHDKVGLKKKSKHKTKTTDIKVSNGGESLKLSVRGERKKKRTKVSLKDKEIKVKIQWKKKRLQVQISEPKVKKIKKKEKKNHFPTLQQYILKYEDQSKPVLEKPPFEVTPLKRKYVKTEKSPDNLKQTSIQSFFKIQLPKTE